MSISKSDQALAYMAEKKVSAPAAAKVFEISTAAIYRRQKFLESRSFCPCCGQVIPEKGDKN